MPMTEFELISVCGAQNNPAHCFSELEHFLRSNGFHDAINLVRRLADGAEAEPGIEDELEAAEGRIGSLEHELEEAEDKIERLETEIEKLKKAVPA